MGVRAYIGRVGRGDNRRVAPAPPPPGHTPAPTYLLRDSPRPPPQPPPTCCAESSWNGTSRATISHMTTPMDHTSHFSHTCTRPAAAGRAQVRG